MSAFTWNHLLYRLFDADSALLYVGRTNDLRERFHKHEQHQPWWGDVARSTIETYPDFSSLCAAEKAAIIDEKPPHNKVYSTIWNVPMRELPDWLMVSARLTAAADALHDNDCRVRQEGVPGYAADSPPCIGCGALAAAAITAADQAAGQLDPAIAEACELMRIEEIAERAREVDNGSVVFGSALDGVSPGRW